LGGGGEGPIPAEDGEVIEWTVEDEPLDELVGE